MKARPSLRVCCEVVKMESEKVYCPVCGEEIPEGLYGEGEVIGWCACPSCGKNEEEPGFPYTREDDWELLQTQIKEIKVMRDDPKFRLSGLSFKDGVLSYKYLLFMDYPECPASWEYVDVDFPTLSDGEVREELKKHGLI